MEHTIAYPTAFEKKVLTHEAPGGDPADVDIVIPSCSKPGEPFTIKLAVLDQDGYPSVTHLPTLTVSWEDKSISVPFADDGPGIAEIKDACFSNCGFQRISAEMNGTVFYSNPTWCSPENDQQIYWGDPHVHTVLSNCHADRCRTLNFCYTAARHLTHLDWVAAADHVSNGRCEFSKWKEQATVSNLYNDPPAFVTLPGYEASLKGNCGGDNNVYMDHFPDMFIDEYEEGNTRTLAEKLTEKIGKDHFFIVPHHTTRTGKHGEIPDEIYPGRSHLPVLEIHSKWGSSEYRGNINPLQQIHEGPSYAIDLLNKGLVFGFIAGTDTHSTMPSGKGVESPHINRYPGITAVRTDNLERGKIFTGIKSRNCYAASRDRIYMDGNINGFSFGSEVAFNDLSSPRQITAKIAGKRDIETIEVVRNGESIYCHEPKSWTSDLEFVDTAPVEEFALDSSYIGKFSYYYLRITCKEGVQAWSSPVWFHSSVR